VGGPLARRVENMERIVEARVRQELEGALERLERHMTHEEAIRVVSILAGEEEPQEGGREERRYFMTSESHEDGF
jgi:hypothetical protein